MTVRASLKNIVGYALVGAFYQSVRKALVSKSIIGSSFYSTLAGLFGKGAYKYIRNNPPQNELEQLVKNPSTNYTQTENPKEKMKMEKIRELLHYHNK